MHYGQQKSWALASCGSSALASCSQRASTSATRTHKQATANWILSPPCQRSLVWNWAVRCSLGFCHADLDRKIIDFKVITGGICTAKIIFIMGKQHYLDDLCYWKWSDGKLRVFNVRLIELVLCSGYVCTDAQLGWGPRLLLAAMTTQSV